MEPFINVSLAGTVTRDPEFKQYPSGATQCRFNVAVNQTFTRKGVPVKETCFIDVNAWGEQAELCRQSLKKGKSVHVDGSLKYEKWVDKVDGKNRSKHTVTAASVTFPQDMRNGRSSEPF